MSQLYLLTIGRNPPQSISHENNLKHYLHTAAYALVFYFLLSTLLQQVHVPQAYIRNEIPLSH